jgi:hypothetical protein
MSNVDGTYTCDHKGCCCKVADDETHPESTQGKIFCCDACERGEGCSHPGCNCGSDGDRD